MQRLVCSKHAMTTKFSIWTDETVKEDGQAEQWKLNKYKFINVKNIKYLDETYSQDRR